MDEHADANDRVIDIWGFVLDLWRHKWVWLITFAVVLAAGAAYALTRSQTFEATQQITLNVPPAADEAQATQQSAGLAPMAQSYVILAMSSPVVAAFMAEHPEFETVAEVQDTFTVRLFSATLMGVKASAPDSADAKELVESFSQAFVANYEAATEGVLPHLRLIPTMQGEANVLPTGSGRAMVLAASGLLAIAVATILTGAWSRLRPGTVGR